MLTSFVSPIPVFPCFSMYFEKSILVCSNYLFAVVKPQLGTLCILVLPTYYTTPKPCTNFFFIIYTSHLF